MINWRDSLARKSILAAGMGLLRTGVVRNALIAVALCSWLPAQAPQSTIKTNVPLVLVPVTVTDKKGNLIDGLTADDFLLTDDGVHRKIQLDTSDIIAAPVSLVVAIQCSGISAAALAKIQRVGGMIQPLITGDRGAAAVVAFDDEVRTIQEFTSDSSRIRVAFGKVHPRTIRAGRMLDAAELAIGMLETRPENSRRVLLILGESRDRGSKSKLPQAIERAQRAAVMIYPATYSAYATPWTAKPEDNPSMPGGGDYIGGLADLFRLGKVNTAEALAQSTGGRHLSFETLLGLENAITRAGEEIHSQYLLSFVPAESKENQFHRVAVSVTSHPDAIVRARPGYWGSH